MHRRPLLEALRHYRRRHAGEAATIDRFTAFVRAHADCFERSLAIGHVTGSAWLVDAAGEQVLLTHHRKLDRWVQLGGHADGDPDTLRVALREAEEESGLEGIEPLSHAIYDLDVHEIPARPGEPAHLHYDVRYALRAGGSSRFTISDESHDLAWVEIAALEERIAERSLLRMAEKWRR